MNQFKTTSLADQVFEKLENDIIQGVYPRGEILTELKLVDQLGVSRTPIREALRRLEQELSQPLTETELNFTYYLINFLATILIYHEFLGRSARQATQHLAYFCQAVGLGLAAYYATKNMTPEGLAQLTHIADLQDFYFDKGDAELLRQVDEQFHDTICYLSKRTVIVDTLLPLHRKTRRYRRISMEDWSRTINTRKEHRAILDAMASGNADLAESLMAKHIENAKKHMLGGFKNHG